MITVCFKFYQTDIIFAYTVFISSEERYEIYFETTSIIVLIYLYKLLRMVEFDFGKILWEILVVFFFWMKL